MRDRPELGVFSAERSILHAKHQIGHALIQTQYALLTRRVPRRAQDASSASSSLFEVTIRPV